MPDFVVARTPGKVQFAAAAAVHIDRIEGPPFGGRLSRLNIPHRRKPCALDFSDSIGTADERRAATAAVRKFRSAVYAKATRPEPPVADPKPGPNLSLVPKQMKLRPIDLPPPERRSNNSLFRAIVISSAEYYSVSVPDIMGTRRFAARARQACMYLLKKNTPRSYPWIARHLGGRHHTTILHGYRTVQDSRQHRYDAEQIYAAALAKLATNTQPSPQLVFTPIPAPVKPPPVEILPPQDELLDTLISTILASSAQYYNASVEDIMSTRHNPRCVRARHACIYLIKKNTPLSTSQIGNRLGGRHRSTIFKGWRSVNASPQRIDTAEKIYAATLERLAKAVHHAT